MFARGNAASRQSFRLPLFPLKTVLFPGGLLPLKIFEQRYMEMAKACLRDERPFGVCLITQGDEVLAPDAAPPQFADVGTLATVKSWDMQQLGVLHVTTEGGSRFRVRQHAVEASGLVVGDVAALPAEPHLALPAPMASLARLLELIATRLSPQQFPGPVAYDDASWVGYRLAELLPLPLSIKQSMLEINGADVRLAVLQKFCAQQGLI